MQCSIKSVEAQCNVAYGGTIAAAKEEAYPVAIFHTYTCQESHLSLLDHTNYYLTYAEVSFSSEDLASHWKLMNSDAVMRK